MIDRQYFSKKCLDVTDVSAFSTVPRMTCRFPLVYSLFGTLIWIHSPSLTKARDMPFTPKITVPRFWIFDPQGWEVGRLHYLLRHTTRSHANTRAHVCFTATQPERDSFLEGKRGWEIWQLSWAPHVSAQQHAK